jgi:hypothetical protein
MAYGPAKPLRLDTELMRAIPPAAAVPVKNFDGNGQKGPYTLKRPAAATDKNITASTGDCANAQPIKPMAETAETAAICRHLYPVRSEWAATITIATRPTRLGMAETKPICRLFKFEKPRTICGSHRPRA